MATKIVLKILFYVLCVWLFFTLWWYYIPHRMLNVKYDVGGSIPYNIKKPLIIVASHVTETVDIMTMCNETRNFKNTTNIVASKDPPYSANQIFKDFPLFTHYNRIDIDRDKKNGTVPILINKVKHKKENILLFVYDYSKQKGLYHIAKATGAPILFVRIYRKDKKDKDDNFRRCRLSNIWGSEYIVEYNLKEEYPISLPPHSYSQNKNEKEEVDKEEEEKEKENFMKFVKKQLYPDS